MTAAHSRRVKVAALSLGLSCLAAGDRLWAEAEAAGGLGREIVQQAGVKAGLCVQLGCSDGELTVELARSGNFLVQAVSTDKEEVARARTVIQSAGLYSRASVVQAGVQPLAHSDNLVNLVVADDLPRLLAGGLSLAEVMRVLCPLGVAYVGQRAGAAGPALTEAELNAALTKAGIENARIIKQQGLWAKVVKPWPADVGMWTHWRGGPGGNPVASDRLIGPPLHIRWMDHPVHPVAPHQPNKAIVSANGRLFYAEMEGWPWVRDARPLLVARDGFNGLVLWKRTLGAIIPADKADSYGTRPYTARKTVVADGDRLYAVMDTGGPLLALDAATGQTQATYAEGGSPEEVISYQGLLILCGGGPVRALEPGSGKVAWRSTVETDHMVAGDGKVFARAGSLVCLEAATGKVLWNVPASGGRIAFYQSPNLYLASGGTTSAVSGSDGKQLWTYEGRRASGGRRGYHFTPDPIFLQGLCWTHVVGQEKPVEGVYVGLDPMTGKVTRRLPHLPFGGRCHPYGFSENYVCGSDFNWGDFKTGEFIAVNYARPACRVGPVIANGLVYTFPQPCKCYPMLNGMMGLAAGDPRAAPAPASGEAALEKGPAYGRKEAAPAPAGADDWPTFRHDPARSAGTEAAVPAEVKLLWQARLGGQLTAPVLAEGKVFVAAADAHTVFALDPRTGKRLWQHTAEGPLDTPPTVHEGLCLFGTRTGWVTCLTSAGGELVWRFRAAPAERRMMAYGQLESPWPVHGSVLVNDGAAFVAAGRASEADGGLYIYALQPRTGRLLWSKQFRTRGAMYRLDPATGQFLDKQEARLEGASHEPPPYKDRNKEIPPEIARLVGPFPDIAWVHPRVRQMVIADVPIAAADGFHVGTWLFGYKDGESRYAGMPGRVGLQKGRSGLLHELPRSLVASSRNRGCSANIASQLGEGTQINCGGQAKGGTKVPLRPKAAVLAGQVFFVAGVSDDVDPKQPWLAMDGKKGGEVWAFSVPEAKLLSKLHLDSMPVFEGMAAAPGRLLVSAVDGSLYCLGKE